MTKINLVCSAPEAQGVRSSSILKFVETIEKKKLELHSFILLRHGVKVAEGWWRPYAPDKPHMLFSLSKSFASTAVGFAVAEGLLTVEDFIVSFFPEELPEKNRPNLAAMRVKHLLTMSTGHAEDSTGRMVEQPEGNFVKGFLSLPVENEPGAPFVYNSGATYMLSAIVQKVTGEKLIDYLRPRLFEPLGIDSPTWESCPRGINMGGWGLSVRTEDIARFGQLYLQKGVWNGKRILPETWVEAASSAQVPNEPNPNPDWRQGYGYQFWRCRNNAYRGDGAFGQYCIVMPEKDAVLAITSGVGNMQAVLDLVWKYLLPAMIAEPLRINRPAYEKLTKKLAGLALKDPLGEVSSSRESEFTGVYTIRPNKLNVKYVQVRFDPEKVTLGVDLGNGFAEVAAGRGEWLFGETRLNSRYGETNKVAAMSNWTDADTHQITLRFYETPFSYTIKSQVNQGKITIRQETNVAFGPRKSPVLRGVKKD